MPVTEFSDGRIDARPRIVELLGVDAQGAEELCLYAILLRLARFACRQAGAGFGVLDFGPAAGDASGRFLTVEETPAAQGPPRRPEQLVADWQEDSFGSSPDSGAQVLQVPIGTRKAVYAHLYLADKRGGGHFGHQDGAAITDLAGLAGSAIDNAWRRKRWLTVIMELPRHLQEAKGRILQLLTEQALRAVPAGLALIAVPDTGGGLRCKAAAGTDSALHPGRHLRFPKRPEGGHAPLEKAVLCDATGLGEGFPVRGKSALIPLALPEHPRGLLILLPGPSEEFSPVDLDMAAAFARQAVLAHGLVQGQRLREADALAKERERIASELNDRVIQRLFAAGLGLHSLHSFTGEERTRERLSALSAELDLAICELRGAIYTLAPEPKCPDPLSQRILRTVRADTCSGVTPAVTFTGPVDAASGSPAGTHLLNILRHALIYLPENTGTTEVQVSVSDEPDLLRLALEIDAPETPLKGFPGQNVSEPHTFHITKTAANTTVLEWRIPWNPGSRAATPS